MPRKGNISRRKVIADPIYGDTRIQRFINIVMRGGKKSVAESIIYGALDIIKEKMKSDPGMKGDEMVVFSQALSNVKPFLEVKSRRVGGSTYQVPMEVRPNRQESLGMRWLMIAANERKEHSMAEKLAGEMMDAFHKRGGAIKKKDDVHRMAEANKAFAHYRW